MDRARIFKEADQVYEIVSRRRSITYTGTHATRPNNSPPYKSKRILETFEQNVAQDVADAKKGIGLIRSETIKARAKSKKK